MTLAHYCSFAATLKVTGRKKKIYTDCSQREKPEECKFLEGKIIQKTPNRFVVVLKTVIAQ